MEFIAHLFLFLITIMLVIVLHEYGHYKVARLFNVVVEKFSIGFGRPIARFKRKGVDFCIGWLPLGGYVKLRDSRHDKNALNKPGDFSTCKKWQRLCVYAAGVMINFISAFLLLWVVFSIGYQTPRPMIGKVYQDSIAENSGLLPQSEIVAVNGEPVTTWFDVSLEFLTAYHQDKMMSVTLEREHRRTKALLDIKAWRISKKYPDLLQSLGFKPYFSKSHEHLVMIYGSPWRVWSKALSQFNDFIHLNGLVLYKMITGQLSIKVLAGPIGIFKGIILSWEQGFVYYLFFFALLSVSIGIINLIPIPGLDGSQILLLGLEAIRQKRLEQRTEALLYRLGFIILGLILVQVMVNDLTRFIK